MEVGVRLGLTSISPTSDICKWDQTFLEKLAPMTIDEFQPLLKGGKRNKPVESLTPSGRDDLPDKSVLKALKEACPNAVFFSTIQPLDPEETATASETGENQQLVRPLRDLYLDNKDVSIENSEKVEKIWANYVCTKEQAECLEKETRGQALCPLWYEQRKGRVTGTKAHDILVRKTTTAPENLVRVITGSKCYNLSHNKAVKWGTVNEEKARTQYLKTESHNHNHLNVTNVGLLIDFRKPFLAVLADGLVSCECCGRRLLEIKCTYTDRDKKISEIKDKDFCLEN